jgi:Ca2+-binding EF-hand superfamily protein
LCERAHIIRYFRLARKVRDKLRTLGTEVDGEEEGAGLLRVFSSFDIDGDGTISPDEFRTGLRGLRIGQL